MPRDSHLLQPWTQQLLREARKPRSAKRKAEVAVTTEEKRVDEPGEEPKEGLVSSGWNAKKWGLVPRNLEEAEFEYLAKRRKGLPSTYSEAPVFVPQVATRTAKVRKVDSAGNAIVYEVIVPEGEVVADEVKGEDVAMIDAPSLAPGTVVEGVGVANTEGRVVANNLLPPPPRKRNRPPPPKRKGGPGRGKKKVMFQPTPVDGAGAAADGTLPTVLGGDSANGANGETGAPAEGDDEEGDEGEDGDEGEEGEDDDDDREEGELSELDASGQEGTPDIPALPTAAPAVAVAETAADVAMGDIAGTSQDQALQVDGAAPPAQDALVAPVTVPTTVFEPIVPTETVADGTLSAIAPPTMDSLPPMTADVSPAVATPADVPLAAPQPGILPGIPGLAPLEPPAIPQAAPAPFADTTAPVGNSLTPAPAAAASSTAIPVSDLLAGDVPAPTPEVPPTEEVATAAIAQEAEAGDDYSPPPAAADAVPMTETAPQPVEGTDAVKQDS